MKKSIMRIITLLAVLLITAMMFTSCQNQSEKVSYNLSLEADNFNVARKLTVLNGRTDTIMFQMVGNFSIDIDSDGDLNVIGENDNGTYYKHFVRLSRDITYIVEDLGKTGVNKYKYEINFNPRMIIPVEPTTVD